MLTVNWYRIQISCMSWIHLRWSSNANHWQMSMMLLHGFLTNNKNTLPKRSSSAMQLVLRSKSILYIIFKRLGKHVFEARCICGSAQGYWLTPTSLTKTHMTHKNKLLTKHMFSFWRKRWFARRPAFCWALAAYSLTLTFHFFRRSGLIFSGAHVRTISQPTNQPGSQLEPGWAIQHRKCNSVWACCQSVSEKTVSHRVSSTIC